MVALRPRVRLGVVVATVLVVALAVVVVILVRSPNRACKGVGIATPLQAIDEPLPAGHPSPEAAVDAFVRGNPLRLGRDPVPVDGWYQDGRYWVRDLPDGGRYELTVVQQANGGWLAAGEWGICWTH